MTVSIYILRGVVHNRKSSASLHTDLEVSHISEIYTGSIPEASFCDSPLNSCWRLCCFGKRSETCPVICSIRTAHRTVTIAFICWLELHEHTANLVNRRLMALQVFASLAAIDRHQLTGSVEIFAYWLDSTETAWWAEISGTLVGMQSFCLPSIAVIGLINFRTQLSGG